MPSGATLPVSVAWIVFLGLPYLFDNQPFLLVSLIALAFSEAFVHTAGIILTKRPCPYTPGLVTAWAMAALAVAAVMYLNSHNLASGWDYLGGCLLMAAGFAFMARFAWAAMGVSPLQMLKKVHAERRQRS